MQFLYGLSVLFFVSMFMSVFVSVAQAAPKRAGEFFSHGFTVGGAAREEFSLLKAEKQSGSLLAERLILTYGERGGAILSGEIGYFHLQLDKPAQKLTLDLSQVSRTAIDSHELAQLFADSHLVEGTDIVMDPMDLSTSVTLVFKRPVEVRVANTNNRNQLTIDFKPLKGEL